jgi:photosystem II stability/assembly factor-like uncharacterized protein
MSNSGSAPALRGGAMSNAVRLMAVRAVVAAAGLALGLCAARARAHDAPQVQRIVWREGGRVLLQTNRGLIFGDSERGPWRLMCNDALPVTTTERTSLTYASDGRLLIATSRGLKVSADDGCSWQVLAFGDRLVPALAAHPAQPDRVYVTTFLLGEASPETSGNSAIQMSDDGGETWSPLRVVPDNDYIHSLAIAPSDPERVYAAGAVYQDGRAFYVLRSSDGGASWERFAVTIEDAEFDLLLLGVSPGDPDVVLAKIVAGEPERMADRLLVSRDAGETWSSAAEIMKLRDAAFSADGSTVWLAGRDGLYRARGDVVGFERVGAAEEMTCVAPRGDALFACGWHAGLEQGARNNGIGTSDDAGDSFEPWMTFQDVLEPIACDAHEAPTPGLCAQLWSDWEYELSRMFSAGSLNGGGPAAVDAGASPPDAGDDEGERDGGDGEVDGAPPIAERDSATDGGCAIARGPADRRASGWMVLGLALCAVEGRRMERRRRGTEQRVAVTHNPERMS